MALKKTIVQPNGITTEYHKINYVSLNDRNGNYPNSEEQPLQLDVSVISYLNKEYRDVCQSIKTEFYSFEISKEEEKEPIRALGYKKLKTTEIFADAEDC